MPEILFALVLVFAVGIGPLAGVLAIVIHATGALGKLFSEVVENASMRPVDGVKAVGGDWFEQMRYGILPQVLPSLTSNALWRFEINMRASAVVGFVGAGGIGMIIIERFRAGLFDQLAFVVVNVLIVIAIIDYGSGLIRKRFIGECGH